MGIGGWRRGEVTAPYRAGGSDAVAESVVRVLGGWLVVGGGGNEATKLIVCVNGGEYRALETATFFADGLAEKVFVALGETRRIGGLAMRRARPAGAVGEDAVGMELGCYRGAGDGECATRGGARSSYSRGVWITDEHSSSVWTILRRGSVTQDIDTGDDAAESVVTGTGRWEADLCGIVGLPSGGLPPKVIVFIAGCEPRDIGHVEGDEAR